MFKSEVSVGKQGCSSFSCYQKLLQAFCMKFFSVFAWSLFIILLVWMPRSCFCLKYEIKYEFSVWKWEGSCSRNDRNKKKEIASVFFFCRVSQLQKSSSYACMEIFGVFILTPQVSPCFTMAQSCSNFLQLGPRVIAFWTITWPFIILGPLKFPKYFNWTWMFG